MKNSIFSILVVLGMLSSCSSQKNLVDSAPFEIGKAYCQDWYGGKEESGAGVELKVPVANLDGYRVNSIYFRGQQSYVKVINEEGQKFVVATMTAKTMVPPKDIIMHSDPKQELGNKPAAKKLQKDFPFELAYDEAVLSYYKGNVINYVKIKDIKHKQAIIYPSRSKE
ncbi:hypothetical protein [Cellulophaga omnivescoria]|uniref:hypothetical protein n=1 Tax=Cellulophaga omnivescoria TaxID=1888890 RepID=UPI0022F03245|nr:hypothetical protein [Cellulophaga omnivescoria]WBU90734.1 hypothetical protein PBN93_06885 [Cellulophaga omnivescoria]WKB82866.1 hypothetical protein QYR09_07465 [Cellulophaga lytica]